jgi:hypothetical protein
MHTETGILPVLHTPGQFWLNPALLNQHLEYVMFPDLEKRFGRQIVSRDNDSSK